MDPKKRPPEWVQRCLWGWGVGELVTGEGFQGTSFLKRPMGLESGFESGPQRGPLKLTGVPELEVTKRKKKKKD